MKNYIISGLVILSFSSFATNKLSKEESASVDQIIKETMESVYSAPQVKTEDEFIQKAIKDGYQAQRDLAFGYQTGNSKYGGYDFISKNMAKSCAWRKILLIANPDKTDSSDPSNERYSCQNLDFKQDAEVWQIVYRYLPEIAKAKANGEYMTESKSAQKSDNLEIIDVSQ